MHYVCSIFSYDLYFNEGFHFENKNLDVGRGNSDIEDQPCANVTICSSFSSSFFLGDLGYYRILYICNICIFFNI